MGRRSVLRDATQRGMRAAGAGPAAAAAAPARARARARLPPRPRARPRARRRLRVARASLDLSALSQMLSSSGAFYTLVPIRPRWRGERRSLRTLPVASLRPSLAFNPRPRRLSTPLDAFQLHPSGANRALPWRLETARHAAAADGARARPGRRVRRRRERAPAPRRVARAREVLRHLARERREQARSISHWSPYDRVGAVNADP